MVHRKALIDVSRTWWAAGLLTGIKRLQFIITFLIISHFFVTHGDHHCQIAEHISQYHIGFPFGRGGEGGVQRFERDS